MTPRTDPLPPPRSDHYRGHRPGRALPWGCRQFDDALGWRAAGGLAAARRVLSAPDKPLWCEPVRFPF